MSELGEISDVAPDAADAAFHRAQMRLGTTLRDKWRLDVLLGIGGAAAVYSATHRNGSRAAVKILHQEMATNAFVRERFLREGYVTNAVGHEGVAKVIDDDTAEDGSPFLVTELLEGETLEDRRFRLGGRLPQDEVLVVADQLLDVLATAHARGVVHRDLKPENVFLTGAGQLKVLDFGIARLGALPTKSNFTQTGALVGTPAYMAPEQARGLSDEVDARSDLWACGATMFFLLSGRCVHEGRTMNDQLVNAITRPAAPLASVAPDVAAAVAGVVDRALEFSKEMRWPDAACMQEAVRHAYLELHGCPITTAPRLTLGEGVPDRSLPWGQPSGVTNSRVPTTARPVALSNGSDWQALSLPRTRWGSVAVTGVVAFGIGLVGVVWMVAGGRPSGPTQAASRTEPAPAALVSTAPVVVLSPSALEELEVTVPSGAATAKAPRTHATTRGTVEISPSTAPGPPAAPSTTRPNCQPPYFVDADTGKKHWRLECL